MLMNKTLLPVYPNCLSTLIHNDVTLSEIPGEFTARSGEGVAPMD